MPEVCDPLFWGVGTESGISSWGHAIGSRPLPQVAGFVSGITSHRPSILEVRKPKQTPSTVALVSTRTS